jgi:hypothetical protein
MVTGLGLMLLGAWGGVILFVGPYFDYAYTPDHAWTWTAGRGYLNVLPGAVAFLAGLVLLLTVNRAVASLAAWLGVAAGAWFVVGPVLTPLWNSADMGTPVGGTRTVAVEQIGISYGLGAVIILFAAVAVGRFSLSGRNDGLAVRATDETAEPARHADATMSRPGNTAAAEAGSGTTGYPSYPEPDTELDETYDGAGPDDEPNWPRASRHRLHHADR